MGSTENLALSTVLRGSGAKSLLLPVLLLCSFKDFIPCVQVFVCYSYVHGVATERPERVMGSVSTLVGVEAATWVLGRNSQGYNCRPSLQPPALSFNEWSTCVCLFVSYCFASGDQ